MFDALRTRLSSRLLIPGVLALVCGSVVSLPAAAAPELPVAPAAPAVGAAAGTDQIIVKFKAKAAPGSAMRAQAFGKVAQISGTPVNDVRGTSAGARIVRSERTLTPDETEKALAALRADAAVEYAEPDNRMHRAAAPNDPFFQSQWGLGEENGGMRLTGAWTASKGAGVVVAVVDTGITSHADLNANVLPGYDMMADTDYSRDLDGRDSNPRDEGDWTPAGMCGDGVPASPSSWHGTQVAGIVAATANDSYGMTGVAPQAKILPVRVLGPCGGYTSDIADGIIWAAGGTVEGIPVNPNPARVINLSLGGEFACSATFQAAVSFAYNSGAAVVAAAGNEGIPAAETSPSNCDNVISVAALDRTGQLTSYSNYGPAVDVAAPGGDTTQDFMNGIVVTYNAGNEGPVTAPSRETEAYALSEGTSMAAPHASGLAALLISKLGDLATPANVETRMETTSRKYAGACQPPKTCGSGALDATAAVNIFRDINTNSSFSKEITWLALERITLGWAEADGSRTFRSAQPVYRDQMAAFLYRLAGSPQFVPPAQSPFADVPTSHNFYKEISWLAKMEISGGWGEADGSKTFRPATPVNRDQMAAFIYRHAGKPEYVPPAVSPFADIPTNHGFYKEIAWLAKMEISGGWGEADGSKTFRPGSAVLRDQMAAFMYRYRHPKT
ncbi:S8 family serine peptidase [Arthrobacter sp.]|uniref:S8 family serine peptidase n=1 Tax=Arthrobacter sp. TaxID=1667 RepID=UPI00281186BC|nr:S8 family serine peptidase [Arthrobacter sp.]